MSYNSKCFIILVLAAYLCRVESRYYRERRRRPESIIIQTGAYNEKYREYDRDRREYDHDRHENPLVLLKKCGPPVIIKDRRGGFLGRGRTIFVANDCERKNKGKSFIPVPVPQYLPQYLPQYNVPIPVPVPILVHNDIDYSHPHPVDDGAHHLDRRMDYPYDPFSGSDKSLEFFHQIY